MVINQQEILSFRSPLTSLFPPSITWLASIFLFPQSCQLFCYRLALPLLWLSLSPSPCHPLLKPSRLQSSVSQFESFKRHIVRTSCSVLIIARVWWWIKIRICDLNKGYGYFLWICGSRNGKSWEGILWLLTESLLGSSVCQWDYTKNHWGSFHKSSGDLEQSNKTWTTFFKTAKRSFLAALAEDALLPSRCALFEWIVPPPCRGVKLNFTEGHNEKWQSHPDPNTSGFNSFTCHTQQKSDQTVNRKSETLTQLTCRPHVCLKSGMSNQLPTLALSGSICKDIYLHIESFSYLHIYKAKCRLNTMSQLFSRW